MAGTRYRVVRECFVGKPGDIVEVEPGMDGDNWTNVTQNTTGCPVSIQDYESMKRCEVAVPSQPQPKQKYAVQWMGGLYACTERQYNIMTMAIEATAEQRQKAFAAAMKRPILRNYEVGMPTGY